MTTEHKPHGSPRWSSGGNPEQGEWPSNQHSTLEDADVVESFLISAGASNNVKDAMRRLEEQLQSVERERDHFSAQADAMFGQKVDAEAAASALSNDVTRLSEQLEASQAALAAFFAEWDGDVGTYAPTDDTLALMRAASSPASEPEAT